MKGKITKIDVTKKSHTGDYKRIYFELENGKFAKTDLVSSFRNYARWKPFLKVGVTLGNLIIKEVGKVTTVNADSFPMLISDIEIIKPDPKQEKLL